MQTSCTPLTSFLWAPWLAARTGCAHTLRLCALLAVAVLPYFGMTLPATAQQELITAEIRPGWRTRSGDHRAGLVLRMAPGWKTYWRAPGDAGIPPLLSWAGSRNLADVQIDWPTPKIDWTDGMRSVVYETKVVLPLTITPQQDQSDIHLSATLQLGVCSDICVPAMLDVSGVLPAALRRPDPVIASAMVDMPLTEAEAKVRDVTCTFTPDPKGLRLTTHLRMPPAGRTENVVIETATPEVWVSVPRTQRQQGVLQAEALLIHVDSGPFAL
ncbi:MAG: protein-disulfide reductase DsbD domain-containing protein, partial [Paracoccaceae bacterium]